MIALRSCSMVMLSIILPHHLLLAQPAAQAPGGSPPTSPRELDAAAPTSSPLRIAITAHKRKAATAAAYGGLRTFSKLIAQDSAGARRLVSARIDQAAGIDGVDRPQDVDRATLGEPFPVYMIRLDQLKTYRSAVSVESLLQPIQEMIFPVVVDGTARSSINVVGRGGEWKPSSFGAPRLATTLVRLRGEHARTARVGEHAFFLVRVPSLKVQFLAIYRAGHLQFIPVIKDMRFGFAAGRAVPAEMAIERLLPAAREHNGEPG